MAGKVRVSCYGYVEVVQRYSGVALTYKPTEMSDEPGLSLFLSDNERKALRKALKRPKGSA